MTKLFYTFLISACTISIGFSQSIIEGKIYETIEGPLGFVNTILRSAKDSSMVKGGITDTMGYYKFEDIPAGSYFIEASMVGYGNGNSEVFAYDGNSPYHVSNITLRDGVELSEVVVTATRPFIEMSAEKIVVNVSNSAVSAGNNALEVLQKSPGVIIDKDNNVSLKGRQGVLVMIDGKNQYMSHEEITRLLESLPASAIESIEIIHNPSARYDAEGNSGVINIKMKRNENLGYNGNVTLSGRQGINTNANSSLMLNYRSEKANIFTNYSNFMWGDDNNLSLLREIPFADFNTVFDQESARDNSGSGHNIRAGADVFLDNKTTLGLLWKGNIGGRDQLAINNTMITGGNAPGFNQLEVGTNGNHNWEQFSYNLNLKRDLNDEGSALTLDADYSTYHNPENIIYDNRYLDLQGNSVQAPTSLRNNSEIQVNILAAQADYTGKIGKVNLELGAKYSSVETDNETIFEDFLDNTWVNNEERSNQFVYEENILASYINASGQIGKANVQVGLRLENTNSDGNSITLDQRVQRSYTNVFPSISLSHQINNKHSLSYNFSRRINRPNYRNLNPFIQYLDDYTFQKGNPFLRPQYADNFGVNYGLGNSLFVSINYSKTTEAMTEVIEQNSETNTTFQTIANLDDFESVNLNVTVPLIISQKWTTRISATGFYNKFTSQIPSGTLDNSQASYHLHMTNEISLPKKWKAEITGWYQSPLVYGLFDIDPMYTLDFGISKRILNGNGTLKVGMSDVFSTLINRVDVNQDDINLRVRQDRDSRRATVSFSYRFGNKKVKQARKRRTATEDAAGRIGEGD